MGNQPPLQAAPHRGRIVLVGAMMQRARTSEPDSKKISSNSPANGKLPGQIPIGARMCTVKVSTGGRAGLNPMFTRG